MSGGKRRTTSLRESASVWLIRLATHHPVAKLFSLAFAGLLVFLIDRELITEIFQQDVAVVAKVSEGERNRLEVAADLPFVVLIDQPLSTTLTVRGRSKQRESLLRQQPFRAKLPNARLEPAFQRRPREIVQVEVLPGDLNLKGFDASRVTLGTLRVPVARQEERKLRLTSVPRASQTVTFTPPEVTIKGPAPYVWDEGLAEIRLDISGALSSEELRAAIGRWLGARPTGGGFISLAEDGDLVVEVEQSEVRQQRVELEVAVQWITNEGGGRYEYTLDPKNPDRKTIRRTFEIPANLEPNLNKAEVQDQLVVYLDVTGRPRPELLEQRKAAAPERPDDWWVNDNAQLEFGSSALRLFRQYQLTLVEDQPEQEFWARLRPKRDE